tara:strand:- start:347 stop:1441 length:1095 start_codon:yes stop_codon:yes gene_type:complete
MIDPKFKDMLTLANMGVTPDALTAFKNHRDRLQQNEDALKMRNSVLFGNTFANPGSQTNATFIPPQAGSMYNNMVTPDDINDTRRDMIRTQANLAMTNNPINPMFNRPARPSGSALLDDVNANSAPVMFQNLNKEAVTDNLEKTIGAVDKRENKLAKRRERLDAVRKFGLALQGKDPNAMDMKKVLQQLQIQSNLLNQKNTQSLIQAREDKRTQENSIIDYARDMIKTDTTIRNKDLYLNSPGLLLEYGKDKLKENPAEVLFNYVQNGQMSVNKFREIQLTSNAELTKLINNSDKYGADIKPEEIIELIKGVSYEDYANNVQGIKDIVNGIIVDTKDLLTDGENTSLQLRKNLDPFFSPLQNRY